MSSFALHLYKQFGKSTVLYACSVGWRVWIHHSLPHQPEDPAHLRCSAAVNCTVWESDRDWTNCSQCGMYKYQGTMKHNNPLPSVTSKS